jgi:quercetin dioxygenase-like cupin family protein
MTSATTTGARLKVVPPGDGDRGELAKGVGVIFKIDGDDAGGGLSIVEHTFAVGALVPPHIHTREDEYSIVLEGDIGFRSEDQEVVLGPGGYIVKPRAEVHAMWNAGDVEARMMEVIAPAGFERFFREFVELSGTAGLPPDEIGRLAAKYELPFARPAWLPDIVSRYGLTPPPGMEA